MLRTTARDLVRRAPVTTTTSSSIREAARIMTGRDVSSVVVVNASRVVGIVTDRDLRRRVVATGQDPADSIVSIMTAGPLTIASDARAFEVMLAMMDARIHHLPVVDGGRLVGVVTMTDLGRFEDAEPVHLVRDIGARADLAGVVSACHRVPATIDRLARRGAGADDLGRVATAIADAATTRALALVAPSAGLTPDSYCWVALGGHGRGELALNGRQDNVLLVDDRPGLAEAALPVAEKVVETLAACGFPAGETVATGDGGPTPVARWRRYLRAALDPNDPTTPPAPELFDARRIAGEPARFETVFAAARRRAGEDPAYADGLVDAAVARLEAAAEISALDDRDVDGPALRAADAVRDLARGLALRAGSTRVTTPARLAEAADRRAIDAASARDLTAAYAVLAQSGVRLDVMRVPPTPADAASVRSAAASAARIARDLRSGISGEPAPAAQTTP